MPSRTANHAAPLSGPARSTQISKSLSWLLRHGAAKERIAIDSAGYVKLSDVLGWGKMRGMKATLEEIVEVVSSNEKQRFGLRWDAASLEGMAVEGYEAQRNLAEDAENEEEEKAKLSTEQTPHLLALSLLSSSTQPIDPSHFSIRAVQGHSMTTIDAVSLLNPLTSSSEIPSTCVHGTFFASWPTILRSGGLKPMGRNHVHFAKGPAVTDIVGPEEADAGSGGKGKGKIDLRAAMTASAVVSGMRPDAEVLIYVSIPRSMAGGMSWWESENGVLLTDGLVGSVGDAEAVPPTELQETEMMLADTEVHSPRGAETGKEGGLNGNGAHDTPKPTVQRPSHRRQQSHQKQHRLPAGTQPQKLVSIAYWDVVVGIGIGVLWSREKGVEREIPENMLRGGGGKKMGHKKTRSTAAVNAKPRMRVERDDLDGF